MINSIVYVEISIGDLLYKRQAIAIAKGDQKKNFTKKKREGITEAEYRGSLVLGKSWRRKGRESKLIGKVYTLTFS